MTGLAHWSYYARSSSLRSAWIWCLCSIIMRPIHQNSRFQRHRRQRHVFLYIIISIKCEHWLIWFQLQSTSNEYNSHWFKYFDSVRFVLSFVLFSFSTQLSHRTYKIEQNIALAQRWVRELISDRTILSACTCAPCKYIITYVLYTSYIWYYRCMFMFTHKYAVV